MNTPMHFPIDEKSIYQMSLNPGPSNPTTSYVNESTTALTNQLLGILNPPTSCEEKSPGFVELMEPHYRKQDEIAEKLDNLTAMVQSFIESQQSINEYILERLYKFANLSPAAFERNPSNWNQMKGDSNEVIVQEPQKKHQEAASTSSVPKISSFPHTTATTLPSAISNISMAIDQQLNAKMSVRDFLKNTMTVVKTDAENLRDSDDDDGGGQTIEGNGEGTKKRFNKFRVRNRPKKVKSIGVAYTPLCSQNFGLNSSESSSTPPQTGALLKPQESCMENPGIELPLMPPSIGMPSTSFMGNENEIRSFVDHTQTSNFRPYMGTSDSRSAFVPANQSYFSQKDRQ
ncbi:unnamed protein product [Caenorhabditis bovis]|uniref:Uncharacterized protein n=1 Tax=Caenorhabditis bovis TaxID=2654633 RepID=A0A8S1F9S5_9PELO|nr:unnamed protein product [Caenorhabditis bovis]